MKENLLTKTKKLITSKYFIYFVCFWGFIGPLIYYISSIGLCTLGTSDAISQIYPIMFYTRRLLLNFFHALLSGEKFVFPMFDLTLGMGDDVISALNWHGFGDPFYLLTVFVSEAQLPYFYSVLFYFRVFLGGLAFIALASELDSGKSRGAYVIGALVYSFTGFTLQSNMHTIFTHAMIYIPLQLLGAERVMRGKKKGVLCAATFCFALSGFYFLYIGSVTLAVYVIYRFIRKKAAFKEAFAKIGALLAEYAVGLGLAAVIFIPAVVGFLSSDRASVKSNLQLILSADEIIDMLKNMFLPSYSSEQELSVVTIGMIAVICVLLAKRRRQEKLNLALLFLTAIIPFFSLVMSGFGECYGRWELVINLYIAFLTVTIWDELSRLGRLQRAGLALVYLLLLFIGRKEHILEHERYSRTLLTYGVLLAALLLLPLLRKIKKERIGRCLMFLLAVVTVCINWKVVARDNDIVKVQDREVVAELLGDTKEGAFYRTDYERAYAEPRLKMNISLFQDYYGTMEYVSIENNRYITAFEKWDITGVNHNIYGLDQRAVLETMCAVKYFVANSEHAEMVPYGFTYVKATEDGEWQLYENQYALPIAYAYDYVYDAEAYQELSGIERQAVMLQAAAAEGYEGSEVERLESVDFGITQGTWRIAEMQDVVLENDTIKADAGGVLTLSVDLKADCENYLFYTGESGGISTIEIEETYTKYPRALSPLVVNLGAVESDRTISIKITFGKAVELEEDSLQLVHQNLSNYAEQTETLKAETEGQFAVETNRISGEVDFSKNKLLCFSVPYTTGWHARVDGENVKTYPVNDLFVGIEVPAGEHSIELYYISPGIRCGAVISLCALLVVFGYAAVQIKNRNRKKNDKNKVI